MTSCTRSNGNKIVTNNKTIININEKLSNGTLTYDDVFEAEYGEYSEKTDISKDILDNLVEKIRAYAYVDVKNGLSRLDRIITDNMDKLVARIIDAENLKYGIYASNGARWFATDEKIKAPLNYFQQQFLAFVSADVLEKISREIVTTMMKTEKDYTINFGILWTVYNDKYKLETCFAEMLAYVQKCEEKVFIKKRRLSQQEVRVLREILEMEKFEQIVTTDFIEYVAKVKIISKGKDMLAHARKVLKENNELK